MQPNYDPEAVKPMEEELEFVGIQPLRTGSEVDEALTRPGTTLVVINSVCGCAAGGARPGVTRALQHSIIPDNLVTVFAGMDHEAVQQVRRHMPEIPPSSPCIALFKDGKLVHILERRHIEQMDADGISENLSQAFDTQCSAQGPSISPEKFAQLKNVQQCGSTIPAFGAR